MHSLSNALLPECTGEIAYEQWRAIAGCLVIHQSGHGCEKCKRKYNEDMQNRRVTVLARVVRHSLPLYIGAGGIATVSHYAVTTAAVEAAQVRPILASIAGFSVGTVVKYWLNYSVAFRGSSRHSVASPRFAIALAVLFGLNAVIFAALNEGLKVHYLVAQVATTIILIGPGYWLHRQWVFRRVEW
jgi:putative flippase GtrA